MLSPIYLLALYDGIITDTNSSCCITVFLVLNMLFLSKFVQRYKKKTNVQIILQSDMLYSPNQTAIYNKQGVLIVL